MSQQVTFLDYEGSVIQSAPAGIQRAAKVASRLDAEILAWARQHVGLEVAKAQLWQDVNARVACEPDSTRRRLDALAADGMVTLGEPTRLGHIIVKGVTP